MGLHTAKVAVPSIPPIEVGGLVPGQLVHIKGVGNGDKLIVSFTTSADYEDTNIPFQVTICLKDKKVIFNHRENGAWGKEDQNFVPLKERMRRFAHPRPL